jgi:hypothetical protein
VIGCDNQALREYHLDYILIDRVPDSEAALQLVKRSGWRPVMAATPTTARKLWKLRDLGWTVEIKRFKPCA